MASVLVVEDELWIRNAVVEIMDSSDLEIDAIYESANGNDAWQLIGEVWPEIVITDIRMPRADGLWLLQQISDNMLPIIPIVLSGFDEFDYAKQAIRYGVSEYLLKPVDQNELINAIVRSQRRFETTRELQNHYLKIHKFIDLSRKGDHTELMQQMHRILDEIFRLKGIYSAQRDSLLHYFYDRLLAMCDEETAGRGLPSSTDTKQEERVRQGFNALLEVWMKTRIGLSSQTVVSMSERACEYIRKNYMDNLTITKMAAYCHISESYFRSLIKQHTGQSFVQYLNHLRIENAKRLLFEFDLKIYQVAELTGYVSVPYFNRTFKSLAGLSPVEYRRKIGL